MWNPFKKTIRVEFVDASTDVQFAQSDVPPEQLPDTFAIGTTMHLGSDDWRVVRAEPLTKEQFNQTGRLRLWMRSERPTQLVDPQDLLYSLPTICDRLPMCDGDRAAGNELVLHEDDWRQVEVVSTQQLERCEREFASVRRVWEHERGPGGVGFRKLHVRREVEAPLVDVSIELQRVLELAGSGARFGVRLREEPHCVRDGFSVRVAESGWLYGCATNGLLAVLALAGEVDARRIAGQLRDIAPNTRLIDWPHACVVEGATC